MSAEFFSQGSADEAIAASLKCEPRLTSRPHVSRATLTGSPLHVCRSGDVVLVNQRCDKLPLPAAALCWASKFGISGNGKGCWDHAALVLRDSKTDVPYLLEGHVDGVRLRSYEERVMQDGSREEMVLLPLRDCEQQSPAHLARLDALFQVRSGCWPSHRASVRSSF